MSVLSGLFDVLLCAGLLWLGWSAVATRRLFPSVILFMVFGLLMAVAWARLDAPDLALAEAAISAGVMGALMLNACQAALTDPAEGAGPSGDEAPPPVPRWLAALACIALGTGLAGAMAWLATGETVAPAAVREAVDAHLLDNPVTVVLLDFRGYDTLLEMAVLLTAFLGARTLVEQQDLPRLHPATDSAPPMVDPLISMATPVLLATALFLFWTGSDSPGGAFQAGALLGALGVMYRLTGRLAPLDSTPGPLRAALALGLGVFSVFATLGLAWAGAPLVYPERAGYGLVLVIEFSLMVSIATTLLLLFSATPGVRRGRSR